MATSHSVWGYCPSHKRNQLVSSRPHATRAQPSVESPPFVVLVIFSHACCLCIVMGGLG